MCGATDDQKEISTEEKNFYKDLTDQYDTIFGQSQ